MSDLSSSQWDTTYDSPSGPVHSIITFQGSDGKYELIDGTGQIYDTGQLSNVKYFEPPAGAWLINGRWSLQGVSGVFQFNSFGGPAQFQGHWAFDAPTPGGGKWNGRRITGSFIP